MEDTLNINERDLNEMIEELDLFTDREDFPDDFYEDSYYEADFWDTSDIEW